jgi:heme A synthase
MEKQPTVEKSNAFIYLSFITALLTIGLIVFGAIVRVTDSGLGCGNDWPLCNGHIFPPLDNLTAWIEWSHRLFAALIGILGVMMLVRGWQSFRKNNPNVLKATVIAAVLFTFQSLLGAFVVIYDLPPTMVTIHLGTAMLLLGALLVASIIAWHKPPTKPTKRDNVTVLAYLTASISLVIIMTGALVRGSGATLACTDWPFCNGQILPFDQGTLATVHMMHRFAVIGLGIVQVMLVYYIYKTRTDGLLKQLSLGALIVYLLQAAVGAFFVNSGATAFWGATHVGMASVTWALLVAVCAIDTLNSLSPIRTLTEQKELN